MSIWNWEINHQFSQPEILGHGKGWFQEILSTWKCFIITHLLIWNVRAVLFGSQINTISKHDMLLLCSIPTVPLPNPLYNTCQTITLSKCWTLGSTDEIIKGFLVCPHWWRMLTVHALGLGALMSYVKTDRAARNGTPSTACAMIKLKAVLILLLSRPIQQWIRDTVWKQIKRVDAPR